MCMFETGQSTFAYTTNVWQKSKLKKFDESLRSKLFRRVENPQICFYGITAGNTHPWITDSRVTACVSDSVSTGPPSHSARTQWHGRWVWAKNDKYLMIWWLNINAAPEIWITTLRLACWSYSVMVTGDKYRNDETGDWEQCWCGGMTHCVVVVFLQALTNNFIVNLAILPAA